MESDFRRILMAVVIAIAVFVGYRLLINQLLPPPPAPATQPAETTAPSVAPTTTTTATQTGPASTPAATSSAPALVFAAAPDRGPIVLGGRDKDALRLELDAHGAAVSRLELFTKNSKGRFVHRQQPHAEEPYVLISPIVDNQREHLSFETAKVWIKEYQNKSWPLDDFVWTVAEQAPDKAVFTTALQSNEAGEPLLRFTKTYRLHPEKPVFDLDVIVENASSQPLTVWIEQDGPIGISPEGQQYDLRKLLTAQWNKSAPELNRAHDHQKLAEATRKNEPLQLLNPERGPFLWTALANKYFAVYTRPLPLSGPMPDWIAAAVGLVAAPTAAEDSGDLLGRISAKPTMLVAGQTTHYPFEIYAGPKDAKYLASVDPAYADRSKLCYQLTQAADRQCACTFGWLQDMMVWLLDSIHYVVRNYGIAIIILVIIVRSLLHPLSVWQQKSMFRMQEAMAKIQPKLNELKERFANDKVRQNQEMMRLFAEEHVNPMSNFVSMVPMLIQMPILVALWTALNTDVNLRHAPFDGWWIKDLSAPDAFVTFPRPVTVPILGDIPWIGAPFRDVVSINLLPILMGVSMWLQQKYMPKPHVQARQDTARSQPAKHTKGGMSPEDQIRQQQIMAYMMSILFPLMFYKMPSGLNLYWMATNVFGICESLIIRKQLAEEKKKREREGPRPPRKPGIVSRFFHHLATQAEDLQRKADEMGKSDGAGRKPKKS